MMDMQGDKIGDTDQIEAGEEETTPESGVNDKAEVVRGRIKQIGRGQRN